MMEVLHPSTPNGVEDGIEITPSTESKQVVQFRERDEVFWTELEIRRIGNLVAECIHARRYIGESGKADEERKQMQKYIDAMKRKSMRVLHRAELYAKSGHASWPGIDPTITDPVSLAEEYVRVVQNYEAVLSEEESRVKLLAKENDGDDGLDNIPEIEAEDWEAQDEKAYKDALKREKEAVKSEGEARKELLGTDTDDNGGIRRRKGSAGSSSATATYSKEEEELMARHQPIQDELTSNLVDLVGQLKKSISENKEKLDRDSKIIDETEDAVDKNLSGVGRQRTKLKKFSQSSSVSWWVMMIFVVVILVVFVVVLVLLRIPI